MFSQGKREYKKAINQLRRETEVFREDDDFDLGHAELRLMGMELYGTFQNRARSIVTEFWRDLELGRYIPESLE